MKKFLLGLMAFLGMAVCFTACGDKEDKPAKEEKTAAESGSILYDSYVAYDTYKDDQTVTGTAAKATAEVSEPPRPSVVTLSYLSTPWKPVMITIFFESSSALMRSTSIALSLALV